jgi:sugar O-acyltransferase (sialic acid O-acetyltransferase NeuD family)
MPTERFVLLGGGGHAKVVLDAWHSCHPGAAVEVRDDDHSKRGASLLGILIQTPIGALDAFRCACHVAIGDNATRRRFAQALEASGSRLVTIVHPQAVVAADAKIARGAFIAAGVIVAPDAQVGAGAIVNHSAIVDHDCSVGDWCHVAPGAVIGGGVTIGEGCLVGSGAVVLPGISIGENAVIGAGAVVTRDVAAGATVVGVPAKDRYGRR